MYCSPVRMRWMAACSASWPVTGGSRLTPAPFLAAIAPPAVPPLAAVTPSRRRFPRARGSPVVSGGAVDGVEDEHAGAVGQRRLGLRLLLRRVLVGVAIDDLAAGAELLQPLLEERPVLGLVARGLRLRQEERHHLLASALLTADQA